jgi:aspartyl/asparaginyl beta-hydroxylase (cupin superfamily)
MALGSRPAEIGILLMGQPVTERSALQRCRHFIPGLRSMPWWDAEEFAATRVLQDNFDVIRFEFLNLLLCGQLRLHPQSKGGPRKQIADGDWNIFELFSSGRASAANALLAPATTQALTSLPEVTTNPGGLAYFSVLSPGVHIEPHCGPVNSRIRIHLGLVVPDGATMRVGYEERPWAEGACTVFDDSWEHEVHNGSAFLRAVLLVDVWHPDLTAEQIADLAARQAPAPKARLDQRKGWLDEARFGPAFEPPSLLSMVGPQHLATMTAAAAKAADAGLSTDLWTGLACLLDQRPGVLSRQDVIHLIQLNCVDWRSSADHELLAWQFMQECPDETMGDLFLTPRQLSGVREVVDWCQAAASAVAPLSVVAAAAVLAIHQLPDATLR